MPAPTIFAKLNLKEQSDILVLDATSSFETEIEKLQGRVHQVIQT